jgi:hypothetical protein
MTGLDATITSFARILATGTLSPEREALVRNAIGLYQSGDREAARAVLAEWHLLPGQPIG